jgi:hypothetical protein
MSGWIFLLLATTIASGAVLSKSIGQIDPVDLSITTQDKTANYYFNLRSPVTLDKDSYLFIEFPTEYETVTKTGAKYVTNYGTGNNQETTATVDLTSKTLRITLPVQINASTDFSIKIEGCKNPKDLTNTGPFKLYTRKPDDVTNSAENWSFATLSFTPRYSTATAVIDTTRTDYSNLVYEESAYYFNIKVDKDIDAGTWFRLTLPTGWTKAATDNDTNCSILSFDSNQSPPTGSYKCRTSGSYVYLEGLGEALLSTQTDRTNFLLKYAKIVNPGY